jgi:hypothetical protein
MPVKISELPAVATPLIADLVPIVEAGVTSQTTLGALFKTMLSFLPSGTGATARTAQAKMRDVLNVADFGASTSATAAANTTAIQAALDALTAGGTIDVSAGTFSCNALTVSNARVKLRLSAGTVLSFATLGANTRAITVSADWFTLEGGKLTGPSSSAYVAGEDAIYSVGTSIAVPRTGLRVLGVEITNFGANAVYGKFLNNVIIKDCWLHGLGYTGCQFLSSVNGRVSKNTIETIEPGTGGNMYGITLTHVTTGYNVDPNAGTKAATNPFCWDWVIDSNHVEDLAWAPIDAHGGYEITVSNNHCYATTRGIEVASSSGDAIAYAGWDNKVIGNTVDASNFDGTDSGRRNAGPGILVNGGSTLKQLGVVVSNNILRYKGLLGSTTSGALSAQATIGVILSNNNIDLWGGSAIHYGNSSGNTTIIGNKIGPLGGASAGAEYCIHTDTADTQLPTITNNVLAVNGGTAPVDGFRGSTIVNLPYFNGNYFTGVSSGEYITPSKFIMRSEGIPALAAAVNNGGGGAAEDVDAGSMIRYKHFEIQITSSNALSEIKDLTNTAVGQNIILYAPAATAWIFNRTNAVLAGGANFTASQYDTLALVKVAATAPKFAELSRSANS